ncbi:MAG: cyclase family protein [Chloroflexi bacterium]|nr:cyclase family protein [Chloroflexota bacterium]MCI0574706.1 cyclase family protein [Chloroflexota bacterium]MCI0647401.1 cyclase family protein [Chloroflexota bacterium]MCI0728880.1 cyclase family protein [Chloroflexota bacterium]
MMTTMIDISRTLFAKMAVWPGDSPFSLVQTLFLGQSSPVNVTTLTMSAHTGSHIDAPHHFTQGQAVEQLDLRIYWGLAQVVTVDKEGGPLVPADFAAYDLSVAERLLVRSPASDLDPSVFPEDFVYPSPELADFLGNLGIILYGTDAPSMDKSDSKALPGHHALYRNNIAILEGLDLSQAADGIYELVALPLKIAGGDGSPVRAVLRHI